MKYLLLLFLFALPAAALAQDYEDDDLGFDSESSEVAVEARDEVEITINGNDFQLADEMTFEKDKVLDIAINYLKPHSKVHIEVKKAGKSIYRNSFDANQAGELLLEIKTGKRKIGGQAIVRYITSSGKAVSRQAKVMIR